MWRRASWRALRSRAVVLLALLLASVAAGCLGAEEDEAPRLASPTNKPIVVPRATPTPSIVVNFSDPGYVVSGSWRVGDAWDYESNQSHVMRLRVVDARTQGGATFFKLQTTRLTTAGEVEAVTTTWVDGRNWTRVNVTDDKGNVDRYTPGAPLRFYKNGTTAFNHSRIDASGRTVVTQTIRLQAFIHPKHETVQARFGDYYEARKVEQVTSTSDDSGARTRALTTRWVHKDILNDVRFQLDNGETYVLTAYKAGDARRGTLADA